MTEPPADLRVKGVATSECCPESLPHQQDLLLACLALELLEQPLELVVLGPADRIPLPEVARSPSVREVIAASSSSPTRPCPSCSA